MRPFARPIMHIMALSIALAGPVAACACADEPVMDMPCCPDDGQHSNSHEHDDWQSDLSDACGPVATEALSPSVLDVPQPTALAGAWPDWMSRGPPSAPLLAQPSPHPSPPIYLVTLRLRI